VRAGAELARLVVRVEELARVDRQAAAAGRYLAAHTTTTRSQHQTFEIARRLHRGERLYEDDEA
jgi:hypothetical protein